MHSTFDFPGGGGVQDGGRDLQGHQHPRHSGGAVDQARADSVEETLANTRLAGAGADSVEEKLCQHPTRPELEPTVWKRQLANTRLAQPIKLA